MYGGNKRETEEEKGRQSGIPLLQENLQFGMKPFAGQKRRKEQRARVESKTRPTATTVVKQVFFFVPVFSEWQPSSECICGRRKLCLK